MDIQKVKYAAEIGKINIDESSLNDIKTELEQTENFLETINNLEFDNEIKESEVKVMKMEDLRDDVANDCCMSQDILDNVPTKFDNYIKVPIIMKKNIKGK